MRAVTACPYSTRRRTLPWGSWGNEVTWFDQARRFPRLDHRPPCPRHT